VLSAGLLARAASKVAARVASRAIVLKAASACKAFVKAVRS